jgi:hypothetical protein
MDVDLAEEGEINEVPTSPTMLTEEKEELL